MSSSLSGPAMLASLASSMVEAILRGRLLDTGRLSVGTGERLIQTLYLKGGARRLFHHLR